MSRGNPRAGFTRLGGVDLRRAGLPAREARRLALDRAWKAVAGEAIARRARAIDVRRGVLEVEIPDPAWARELAPLLPRIAARLAAELPDRGVRKLRCVVAGEAAGRPVPIDASAVEDEVAAPRREEAPPPKRGTRDSDEEPFSTGDLLDVAASYLDAARRAGRG